ncbi:MAG: alpha/beta hydrolase [Parvularculaceae bacterium]|nr:alpha/beta hydrolase [Parvularculaceae bacterium]
MIDNLRAHHITANGLTHHVRDTGDKEAAPAILLHGFPDSSAVWDRLTPFLVDGGYRVIAPDMRGFGESGMAEHVADYDIRSGAAIDVIAILDALKISRAHLVGHDFGAPVAWMLAAQQASRFHSLTALSVGHTRAFLGAGSEQKRRSFYILVHQLRGICEWLYQRDDWALLRKHWEGTRDPDETIRLLSRPGRLTAGLNWYRANVSLARMISSPEEGAFGEERVRIPTLGVWSSGEKYLVEAQMRASGAFVDASWTYARIEGASHWMQDDAPEELAKLLLGHWRAAEYS